MINAKKARTLAFKGKQERKKFERQVVIKTIIWAAKRGQNEERFSFLGTNSTAIWNQVRKKPTEFGLELINQGFEVFEVGNGVVVSWG